MRWNPRYRIFAKRVISSNRVATGLLAGLLVGSICLSGGCRERYREDLDYSYGVEQTWSVDELTEGEFVQFESVFWEPDDTTSLRKLISSKAIASGRDVLEIGTGTGLISVLCLLNSAKSVVATDINRAAVANASYNAAMLCPDQSLDVRQVDADSPGAFSVINDDEQFDLVISNPPWEDGDVDKPADHAFYDPGFRLMDTLLDGLPVHLKPGGRCLLAYGNVHAIKRLISESEKRGFAVKVLDDRDLDSLPEDFLPGMLLEVRPAMVFQKVQDGDFKPSNEGNFQREADDDRKSKSEKPDSRDLIHD